MVSSTRSKKPLCEISREDDEIVVSIPGLAGFFALRHRVSAPLSSIASVRAVAPGERVGLHLRVMGTGWPGFHAGLFWRKGRGRCFVVRRSRREAVEIEFTSGRLRQWIVEVPSAADAVAEIEAWTR